MMGSDDVMMMMMGGFSFDGCMDTSLAIRQWAMRAVLSKHARATRRHEPRWLGSLSDRRRVRCVQIDHPDAIRTFRDGAAAAGWAASRSSG